METCEDCGGSRFTDFQGDYTCTSCGLVVMERMMTDDKEWRNFSEEYGCTHDKSRVGEPVEETNTLTTLIGNSYNTLAHFNNIAQDVNRQREENLKDVLMYISNVTSVPDSVIDFAKSMVNEYYKKSKYTFKGDTRRLLFASAAVYFSTKSVTGASRSSYEICSALQLCPKMFHKVCTQMSDILRGTQFEAFMVHGEVDVVDTLMRMIRSIPDIPENAVYEVRKKVLQLYERIRSNLTIMTYATEKLNATLIYMVCMILKLGVKMKTVSAYCNTSLTTIINIETEVKKLLTIG